MKDNTYVVIQAFMLNELQLKGNELIVYAVIYGYTQDGNHWYYGTRGHLAEWCGASKGTISNCLKSLVSKGYIRRREIEHNGIMQVQYQVVIENCPGISKIDIGDNKNCTEPVLETDIYNIIEEQPREQPNNRGFKPPTAEEVAEYMKKIGKHIDAEAFCDYWESIGWMRGKTKMKDWKASARTWARNEVKWRSGKNKEVRWDAELNEYADELSF